MSEPSDARSRERREIMDALIRTPPGPDGRAGPACSPAVRTAAVGLWIRATLRLPLVVFASFYLSRGIAIAERSTDFPDGAFFTWLYYVSSEADNVVSLPVAWLVSAGTGSGWAVPWLVAYSTVTVGYLIGGLLVWRGSRSARRLHRVGLGYLVISVGVHALTLIAVVPGAVDAVRTGENAPIHPYPGVALVHAYEWLLLPWALALPVLTVVIIAALRADSTRAHLGLPVRSAGALPRPRRSRRGGGSSGGSPSSLP